jgi:hypothetical protein
MDPNRSDSDSENELPKKLRRSEYYESFLVTKAKLEELARGRERVAQKAARVAKRRRIEIAQRRRKELDTRRREERTMRLSERAADAEPVGSMRDLQEEYGVGA